MESDGRETKTIQTIPNQIRTKIKPNQTFHHRQIPCNQQSNWSKNKWGPMEEKQRKFRPIQTKSTLKSNQIKPSTTRQIPCYQQSNYNERKFTPYQTKSTPKSIKIKPSTTGRFHVTNNPTTMEQKYTRSIGTEKKNSDQIKANPCQHQTNPKLPPTPNQTHIKISMQQ